MIALLPAFINALGTSEKNLVSYDIESSKVPAGYESIMEANGEVAATLHYNADKTDYDFSIYVNHPGFDFGYHFRTGGSIYDIEDNVAVFCDIHDDETILISLNKPRVSRIEIYGMQNQVVEVDENEPFVVIVPPDNTFKLFDDDNKEVIYRTLN
jgi:hypothetical protein